ncbi:hypothetical protein T8T21_00700 [Limimaricola variabilis]|uniref:hypothetical protein n=1 Tax=Limimaricola variabilis TaxID=1492771 RepID=UPI002AC8C1FF|nr:hypothetical protein [Limimaricola variabilis]WPY94677.1 hypothetical protein T8T21_00700 [Limimaricola variabilis]
MTKTPAPTPPLPGAGGSYTRSSSGQLDLVQTPTAEAPDRTSGPARRPASPPAQTGAKTSKET